MAELKLPEVKEIATSAELELYQLSRGRPLTSLSRDELRQQRTRAREFRKKWRDQYAEQRRSSQQSGKAKPSATQVRTQRKVQLFEEILKRFEDRLQKIDSGEVKSPAGRTADTPTKQTRNRQERASRSEVRKAIRVTKKTILAEKDAPAQKAARPKKAKATPKSGQADASAVEPARNGKTRNAPKVFQSELVPSELLNGDVGHLSDGHTAGERNTDSNGKPANEQIDPVNQAVVAAAVNQKVIDKTGLTNRVLGHVSAAGRRSQAARNARKRT